MRLSYSQLNDLHTCGHQWLLSRHVEGAHERPHLATLAGSAVHTITECLDLAREGVPFMDPLTPEEWREDPYHTFKRVFDQNIADALDGSGYEMSDIRHSRTGKSKAWPSGQDYDWFLAHAPGWVDMWEQWRNTIPYHIWYTPAGVPGIELEYNVEFGQHTSKGFVDRVYEHNTDGSFLIVDLKAGQREPDSPAQLGGYRLGLKQEYGIDAKTGTFYMARDGKSTEMYDLSGWNEEELGWEFDVAAKKIELGLLAPNRASCKIKCGFRDFCHYDGGKRAGEIPHPFVSIQELQASL